MAKRERVARAEVVFRAITEANTDGIRIFSAAFRTSAEISLCRSSIYSQKKIASIFHRDVKDPVILLAELTVAQIEDAGNNLRKGPPNKLVAAPFPLTVLTDSERCNSSHAVIPERSMPERLAKELANLAVKHDAGRRSQWHIAHRRIRIAIDWLFGHSRSE